MCTRYTLKNLEALKAFFALHGIALPANLTARYNVTLTTAMPVAVWRDGPVTTTMNFGFNLPARGPAERPMMIANARAESALTKPAFREATRHRRCLIPADGFFEWEKVGTARLPHYFTLADRSPFFFAGLWRPAGESAEEFCIMTTAANRLLQPIHDRIPVILGPTESPAAWLGDEPLAPGVYERICTALPAELMTSHRVDSKMNHVRYQEPDAIAPATAQRSENLELF